MVFCATRLLFLLTGLGMAFGSSLFCEGGAGAGAGPGAP